ncbi:oligosaccharide flippase family protein, partial [Kineosporia rhizophila]
MTAVAASPKQELVVGAGWLTVSTLTVGGLNYGYALALTHLLPADRYAQFAAAQALLLTAGTVASASIPWVLAQQLARNPDPADRAALTRMALLGNCIQGLLAAAVILAVAQSFADPQTSFTLAVCVFLIFVSSTTPGWLQGQQRFGALAAVKVVEVLVKCAAGLVLALATATAAAPLGAFGAGAAVVLLFGLGWFRRE